MVQRNADDLQFSDGSIQLINGHHFLEKLVAKEPIIQRQVGSGIKILFLAEEPRQSIPVAFHRAKLDAVILLGPGRDQKALADLLVELSLR